MTNLQAVSLTIDGQYNLKGCGWFQNGTGSGVVGF